MGTAMPVVREGGSEFLGDSWAGLGIKPTLMTKTMAK